MPIAAKGPSRGVFIGSGVVNRLAWSIVFTGIIRHVGVVLDNRPAPGGRRLKIDLGPLAEGLGPGGSVAVAGACLTATAVEGATAAFDVVAETLSATTLGLMRSGAKVNLETALALDQALDGHLVQGHVDGVAEVRAIRRAGEHVVEFAAPARLTAEMVPKGSIAVDGVSLTLTAVADDRFSVALIAATLERTTLGDLAAGDKVNVETDIIGKYVRRYMQRPAGSSGRLTLEKLRQAGFA